ncbi:hypothetical protein Ddye_000801 [Dipteronia dyeriana]|uniref:SWIM-type domain-containing protein n=1 Tax=Dipteronia dyeriana TaxID=168575 RepID=A0AAD9XMS3_9ROSI|nr:hypothetical protein Ddye_000801 [Dipteronia dyeriana]
MLVEYVRDMMQKWFHERRVAVSRNTTQPSRWATEKLTKKNETSHKYTVRPIDHVNFNIKDGEKDGLVNLSEKSCTCKEFQNDLLPCIHPLAAIRHCKKIFGDFCSDFYKTSTWLESYSGLIFLVGHLSEWNTPEETGDLKPVDRERIGFRLQASMVGGVGIVPYVRNLDTTDKNCANPPVDQQCNVPNPQTNPRPCQRRKCKSCGQEGHNIRTCPTRPYDNPMGPDNDVE